MRLLFFGTPQFAAVSLKKLISTGEEIVSVVTQPDRPRGRSRAPMPPPVKVVAQEHGLSLLQPDNPRDPTFLGRIEGLAPDLTSVVAYGHILRKDLLDIPRLGNVGLHPSLLPKYRGAAPINWALIRGERTTGLTTFFMDEAMDRGEIILQREVEIGDDETAGELESRLAQIGADLLAETLSLIGRGEAPRVLQDDFRATYAPKVSKEDCLIDWKGSADEVRNLIRGLSPRPGAYTLFRGERLKILRTSASAHHSPSSQPGQILQSQETLSVACGRGVLLLKEVQPEGSKLMTDSDFINGYRPESGERLG